VQLFSLRREGCLDIEDSASKSAEFRACSRLPLPFHALHLPAKRGDLATQR
jgi:hypothetical protein